MDGDNDPENSGRPSLKTALSRLKRGHYYLIALILLILLLSVAVWQRVTIADRIVQRQLAAYGVKASYDIRQIGLRTQRLANIIIGDPENPDFTADEIEVDVALNFTGASITAVRAKTVRLHGHIDEKGLSFGELDKFSDPEDDSPFEMPDWEVSLRRGQVSIDGIYGPLTADLTGNGLLRHRFTGRLSLKSPQMADQDCLATNIRFDGRYFIDKSQPGINGPFLADRVSCRGVEMDQPVLAANFRLGESFDRWFGQAKLSSPRINFGETVVRQPEIALEFDGSAGRTNYILSLARAGVAVPDLAIANVGGRMDGHFSAAGGNSDIAARGQVSFSQAALSGRSSDRVAGMADGIDTSPADRFVARLVPAVRRAMANFGGTLRYDLAMDRQGNWSGKIDGLQLSSRSGANVRQSGAASINVTDGNFYLSGPVGIFIQGGDFPSAELHASRSPKGTWSGNFRLAPYRAAEASLAVARLDFTENGQGRWSFSGNAAFSGPVAGAEFDNIRLPLNGWFDGGQFALFPKCSIISFDGMTLSSLRLDAQKLSLCPARGRAILRGGKGPLQIEARMADLVLRGHIGDSLFQAAGNDLTYSSAGGLSMADTLVQFGDGESATRFDVAHVSMDPGLDEFKGRMTGGKGKIATVPVGISAFDGEWRFDNDGLFTLDGMLKIFDRADVDRFLPLVAPDFHLTLKDSLIRAEGNLREPEHGRLVANADISHDLGSGIGSALLSVDKLAFDPEFQPELLTPLTLGVVANVAGQVDGSGLIKWDGDNVTSTGKFTTRDMNLAAAFGPVEGLETEIRFSNLLALATPPGQVARIRSVNPGIEARDGEISYQILPDNRVRVEGGRWPFAGGELVLEPTILEFDIKRPRLLTFRVTALDAEKFLAPYEFENLRVSGTFDGVLPMIFDQHGGKIVGGSLVSRPGGGEVSYIGELSYEDMGAMANFAFNALKSIRYQDLNITVDGNIDGEIITKVSFGGVQQGSLAHRNFFTRQLGRIPVRFNVSITAKFLQLITSIRSLYDANYGSPVTLPDLISRQDILVGEAPDGNGDGPDTGQDEP